MYHFEVYHLEMYHFVIWYAQLYFEGRLFFCDLLIRWILYQSTAPPCHPCRHKKTHKLSTISIGALRKSRLVCERHIVDGIENNGSPDPKRHREECVHPLRDSVRGSKSPSSVANPSTNSCVTSPVQYTREDQLVFTKTVDLWEIFEKCGTPVMAPSAITPDDVRLAF